MTFKELQERINKILKEDPSREDQEVWLRLKMSPDAKLEDQNVRLVSVASSGEQPKKSESIIGEVIVP